MTDDEQKWTYTPADLLCYNATKDDESAETYKACELFIKATVPAQGLSYLKIEAADPTDADAATPAVLDTTHPDSDWIRSSAYDIHYQGTDDQNRVTFSIVDNISLATTQAWFGVQYYDPYIEDGNDSSGAYDFKLGTDMSKHVYSTFQSMETYRTTHLGI